MCVLNTMIVKIPVRNLQLDKLVSLGGLAGPKDMTGEPTHTAAQLVNDPENPLSMCTIADDHNGRPTLYTCKQVGKVLTATFKDGVTDEVYAVEAQEFIGPHRPHHPHIDVC